MMGMELTKDIWTLIASILGTFLAILAFKYQSKKSRMEMVVKLEEELEKNHKHSVMELFRLLHGFRMEYSKISQLLIDDKSTYIIHALKKSPGMVKYNNGKLEFTNRFKNKILQSLFWHLNKILMYFYALASFITTALITIEYVDNISSALFTLISLLILFIYYFVEYRYDRMVADLLDRKKCVTTQVN